MPIIQIKDKAQQEETLIHAIQKVISTIKIVRMAGGEDNFTNRRVDGESDKDCKAD